MLVARYYNNRSIRLEPMDKPTIGAGEVLVRVVACGICGSDTMEWFRVPKSPRILGHEITGLIAESRSDDFRPGDRVVVQNQVPCGTCHPCNRGHHSVCERTVEIQPGGMAEYIRLPVEVVRHGLFRLPERVPFEAGTLVEPIACTLHSQRLARIEAGQCVVVIGCGIAGLLHVRLAALKGVQRIVAVDPVEYRRQIAGRLGASSTLDPKQNLTAAVRELNDGQLADVAIIACGADEAIDMVRKVLGRYGTILLFGASRPETNARFTLNQLFWRNEFTMVSSYGVGNVSFGEAIALLDAGKVDPVPLITDCVPLASVQEGFDIVSRAQQSLKVVLEISAP